MSPPPAHRVVHLELHSGNAARACWYYEQLLGWRPEVLKAGSGRYLSVDLSDAADGGVVETDDDAAAWLPYVAVPDVMAATRHAMALGAAVDLSPREGPAGWRSVVSTPAGGRIAFWQSKSPGGSP